MKTTSDFKAGGEQSPPRCSSIPIHLLQGLAEAYPIPHTHTHKKPVRHQRPLQDSQTLLCSTVSVFRWVRYEGCSSQVAVYLLTKEEVQPLSFVHIATHYTSYTEIMANRAQIRDWKPDLLCFIRLAVSRLNLNIALPASRSCLFSQALRARSTFSERTVWIVGCF